MHQARVGDLVTEQEARSLMALPKMGDPPQAWMQHRTHKGMATLTFGVLDLDGATHPGLHVECAVVRGPRVAFTAWKITLFYATGYALRRAYQIDNPGRAGMRPGDHQFPHEHIADARQVDNPHWHAIAFDDMLATFCNRCNLILTSFVPDPDAFNLR